MAFTTVFERYEVKYLITKAQKERILEEAIRKVSPDAYGRSTVRNVYYDTDTFLLARRSNEGPLYKEKLRLRSYTQASGDSTVFAELKKKFDGVVYKRRLALPEREAAAWFCGGEKPKNTQIANEIDFCLHRYETVRPAVFLAYDREAYFSRDGSPFRMTFDDNIVYRREALSLCDGVYGTPLLPDDTVLMELKCDGTLPLWVVRLLTKERIYKTSFSKYGRAYQNITGEKNDGLFQRTF